MGKRAATMAGLLMLGKDQAVRDPDAFQSVLI